MSNSSTNGTIGRYTVRDEIGRGGMATVYRATLPGATTDVAVKLMSGDLAQEIRFRQRFQREANVLRQLRHKGIVEVTDFGEHAGRPYLVMPYLSGGTLADRLAHGPLPPRDIAAMLPLLANALDYAHLNGFVHRDIKPSNILFDDDGRPYLTDFGIVKILGELQTAVTQSGSWVGTPQYMSPEQFKEQARIDGRSDIYSLGVVLFEMLTGRLPFANTNPFAVAIKHMTEPPPRLRNVAVADGHPAPAPGWQPILDRALAKSPADRYPNATAMATAVSSLIIPSPVGDKRPPVIQRPRSLVLLYALPALAVLLSIGALWAASNRPTGNAAAPDSLPTAAIVAELPASATAEQPATRVDSAATSSPAPTGTLMAVVASPTESPATNTPAGPPNAAPRLLLTEAAVLRAGPGAIFDELTQLAAGNEVDVLGRDEVWAWYNVRLDDGRTGWLPRLAGRLLDPAAQARIVPVATLPAPPATGTSTFVASPTAAFPTAALVPTTVALPTAVVISPTAAPLPTVSVPTVSGSTAPPAPAATHTPRSPDASPTAAVPPDLPTAAVPPDPPTAAVPP
ncbi:MAG: protein kinase [Anaerolineales bacterium]|uniref:protein kinase domain-containing protein n=1 Tax=Promineifilum sp. TaxID=2664178 RepID=UPI001DB2D6D3|nr:protein kinase [Anaerolineales bacterium]MCO5181882.1 protein kinase [Promineifilum sp.]